MKENFVTKINTTNKIYFFTIIDYVIFIMFLFFSFVDCLTGASTIIGIPSIGVPYKLLLILFMTISCKSNKIVFIFYFFSIIFISAFSYFFRQSTSFMDSLSMMLRIIMCPFLYFYIKDTYLKYQNYKKYFEVIFSFNFFTVLLNQLYGLLGGGRNTYSDGGFGIKGVFFDGNALAIVCFCMFVFYFSIFENKKRSLLIFFCVVLLATKTAILSTVLFFFFVLYCKSKKKYRIAIIFLFLIVGFIFYYLIFFTDSFVYHVDKFKRLYKLFGGNIIDVLLSGRSLDLRNHLDFYVENFSLSQFFFGYGFRNNVKIIELDFFDTLLGYGLFTFLPIVFFYIHVWIQNRRNKYVCFFNFLYFLFAITVGHVWFNTSAALFFAMINLYYGDNKNEKCILYN